MSTKYETPANDGQSNHSDRDDVVNLMLFSCAFDKPPVSSSNDSSSPTSGPGNLLRMSDWAGARSTSDTAGSVVDKVMGSLGNMLHNPSDSGLPGILPSVHFGTSENNHSPGSSVPSLSNLLNGSGTGTDNPAPRPQSKPVENGTILSDLLAPKPQSKPHENGSGSGTDHPTPRPQSKPHSRPGSGSDNSNPPPHDSKPHVLPKPGSGSDNSNPPPHDSKPHVLPKPGSGSDNSNPPPHDSKPHVLPKPGSGSDNSNPPPHDSKPHTVPKPSSGSDKSSLPPHQRTPIESMPPSSGSDKSSLPPHQRTPIESTPSSSGSDRSSLPPHHKTPIESNPRDIDTIKFPYIDRSPKFKFPEDKPLDAKQADEMADKVSKWIKESVDKDGNLKLDPNTLDRLKEALQYGINHGEKGLQEMIAKINKKLEGSGLEIKSDGKAFAHFRTCMPDIERGDHLGDFIGFDVLQNGKKVDSNLVKVGPGVFDRDR